MVMGLLTQIQSKVKVAKDLRNNFGGFNYRNVESIYEAIKPILAELECDLILSDEILLIGDRFYLKATATLRDSKGNVIGSACAYARESLSQKGMSDPQCTGSASSYARKYALGGLLLLDDSKDIDSIENHTSAKGNANKDLNAIKQEVASALENAGLKRADFTRFFEFANIDKDNADELKAFLLSDYKILISDFILGGKNV